MAGREPMWRRALRLVRPDPARDVDDEMSFHLAMREAEFVARGMHPDEARREAEDRFGDLREAREACVEVDSRIHRAERRVLMLEELGQDLRFALRTLRQRPGFAAAIVVTLSVGIGATTAIFALLHAILLAPPAQVLRPQELAAVYTSDHSGPRYGSTSLPDYEDFRTATDVFAGLASYQSSSYSVKLRGNAQVREAEAVSGNYFAVLGVPMQRGRSLSDDDDQGAGRAVAIISDRVWRTAADADPNVVGEAITLNGQVFTVVGVAPPGFKGERRVGVVDLWISNAMANVLDNGAAHVPRRDDRGLSLIGRLRPGVSREAAQARLDAIAAQLFAAWPELWRDVTGGGRHITVLAEKDARVDPDRAGQVVGLLGVFMGSVTLLFLLCSANVATLLVARGAARSREIAVRLSLGAGRGRLIRQLMTENLVLAVAGGLAGIWVAGRLTAVVLAMLSGGPGVIDLRVRGWVLAFAVAMTLGSVLLFGLMPSLGASRVDVQRELKGGVPGAQIGRRRFALRDILVTVQVALSLVLLAGAGLLIQSLRNTQRTDVGFESRRTVLIYPSLGYMGYDSTRARAYYRAVESRAAALPGVRAVTMATAVPLGGGLSRSGITVEDYVRRPGEDLEFGLNRVEPGYFRTMGIPLMRGRDFDPADREGAPGAAIVNETFAGRFWPGASPLGRRIRLGATGDRWFTIVGVVRDIDYGQVGEEARPYFYLPYAQYPSLHMAVHVRTTGDEGPLLEALQAVMKEIDPDVPVGLSTMEERVARLLAPQRLAATLLAMLGGVGLLLAGTGLYGVLAFTVTQRTREFGIRMALGATSGRVRRMVIRQGVLLAAAGVLIGLGVAAALTRVAAGLLFGIGATDPLTFAVVVLTLLGVAVLASWTTSRRVRESESWRAIND